MVACPTLQDAQLAIKEMNGAILPQYPGMKAIRTGWATRKPTSQRPQQVEGMPSYYQSLLIERVATPKVGADWLTVCIKRVPPHH